MLCSECEQTKKYIEEIREEINDLEQFPSRQYKINHLTKELHRLYKDLNECEICKKAHKM